MADKLYTFPIDKLTSWILSEEKEGKIFGYYKELFFTPSETDTFRFYRYGQLLENPLGVAAGPHSQLSQNIILSWLFGARYIELKTVQILDELEITKPCIDMTDEGYNCEWSQELKIEESFDEYLNAWIIIHLLKHKFGWNVKDAGFIFNLSVGYDLKGIQSESVTYFLRKMKDASSEIEEKRKVLSKLYPQINEIEIPVCLSDNITLSTMHGCPPDEIEAIASYLMKEWKLHTAVKLNPTLLGSEIVRSILNDKLGYPIQIPEDSFEHDLKYDEAKSLITKLTMVAKENNVEFGLKLTNTLEAINTTDILPSKEKKVYLSGRALHPISINLAAQLQSDFNGELDLSFSAGVDAFNFTEVITCNLKPATVCSDLLKPGGYSRLPQYLQKLSSEMKEYSSTTIDEFILTKSKIENINQAVIHLLKNYADKTIEQKRYHHSFAKNKNIKTKRELTTLDCIHAPCIESCAITQDVPGYMYYTSKGNFEEAYKTILDANPLPGITGMVCDHLCQTKCTRMNIDNSLLIREIKRFNTEKTAGKILQQTSKQINTKVAVIGAGPSGLTAAYFLALEGADVSVYESHSFAGGMAADAIPVFRITKEAIENDINLIKSLDVKFYFDTKIDSNSYFKIKGKNDFVYIAIGAQKGKQLQIEGEDLPNVFDQLTFLSDVLQDKKPELGKNIAIIGGGNSAMDAARTAKRLAGNDGNVTVIYRRTKKEMPADKDEVEALLEENISLLELTAPEKIIEVKGKLLLTCSKMELRSKDSSGRPRPVKIPDSEFSLEFDSIITAIGQDTVLDFYPENNLKINWLTHETNFENVFAGGDAVRGADSLINAMADGKNAALSILKKIGLKNVSEHKKNYKTNLKKFQGMMIERNYGEELSSISIEERKSFNLVHPTLTEDDAINEASRCLYCDEICNICVTVCPNVANLSFEAPAFESEYPVFQRNNGSLKEVDRKKFNVFQQYQILNVADWCNECGNCVTFCPTSGSPFVTKPRFALSQKGFETEDNIYYFNNDTLMFKQSGNTFSLNVSANNIYYNVNKNKLVFDKRFNLIKSELDKNSNTEINTVKAAEMYYYYLNLKEKSLFG